MGLKEKPIINYIHIKEFKMTNKEDTGTMTVDLEENVEPVFICLKQDVEVAVKKLKKKLEKCFKDNDDLPYIRISDKIIDEVFG